MTEITDRPTLVVGATGKTGRRVAERLAVRGVPVRRGSRPVFDWEDRSTWRPALEGMGAVSISYFPDLAAPGAPEAVGALVEDALAMGVRRVVLLSGRGEPEAQRAEEVVLACGADVTIVRCAWFMQNFSESVFLEPILDGTVALPDGGTPEPFVDVEDIADVMVAALTDDRHVGELYELTGPRLLTFAEATAEIAAACRREVAHVPIGLEDLRAGMLAAGEPAEVVDLVVFLFGEVLDGRNASLADGVQRALGRAPRDFAGYAARTAASGIWAVEVAR